MAGVPLLSGSRIVTVPVGADDVVLRPPPPPTRVVDVAAAVRDALSFPLSGGSLDELTRRGARVTVVVEPPSLPLPGAQIDPRPVALATVLDELEGIGIADEDVTLLVAGGLARRIGRKELERLLPPPQARAFRGSVVVHDAADPDLVPIVGDTRVNPAVVEADLVVVVSSAETVVHGGPGSLLAACDAATVRRAAAARSLVQASGEPAWELALAIEEAVARRVGMLGVSLVLDHPRLRGDFRDYPHEPAALEHVARSPFRRLYSLLPGAVRRGILRDQSRALATTAAFAGLPSVAHAEALVRAVELRGTRLDEPLDAIVVGVPWIGTHVPREPLNPITSAAVALGLALRQWRDAFPVREDGTLVLVHSLTRSFAHGTQDPYRSLFEALRSGDARRCSPRPRRRQPPTSGHSAPIAPGARVTRCFRTPTGRAASPRSRGSDASSSREAATRSLRARSDSSRATRSRARSRWRTASQAGARGVVLLAPPYAPLSWAIRDCGGSRLGISALRRIGSVPRRGRSCGPARSS